MKKIKNGIVFSEDIKMILEGKNAVDFDYTDRGLIIPSEDFINALRFDFKRITNKIFEGNVTMINEEEMIDAMNFAINDVSDTIIISLDKIYLDCNKDNVMFLDCTRLNGSSSLVSRKNMNDRKSVVTQIMNLSNYLKNIGINEIILADDVVFSGNVLRKIITIFRYFGIKVLGIRSCISTEESYNYFNSILPCGLKCGILMSKEVIDQICERDFYFGIAQSGISYIGKDGYVYKAPYFIPFGDPNERASIPKSYVIEFSKDCLERSINLWEEIENLSNKEIGLRDLPEKIITGENERVIRVLKKELKRIWKNYKLV